MDISLIWAMDQQRLIGVDNRLPWRLPADMAWFRRHTLGKPIVMGRRTFESFGGRPLPHRTNIVVSRDPHYRAEGALVVHSIDQAIEAATGADELMVIGGASFYAQLLPQAERLYITEVQGCFEGDAWFPECDLTGWRVLECSEHPVDERNAYACCFSILERIAASPSAG